MNLLRNPIVVGGLVVIALGIVGYQIFQPRWPGSRANSSAPSPMAQVAAQPVAPPVAAPAQRPAAHPPTNPPLVERGINGGIDKDYVRTHLDEWMNTPTHDPFVVLSTNSAGVLQQSPVVNWHLKAVWRQTGGRLAAINHGIYKEGDLIEGYTVERIEADQVWFQGPNTKERLAFDSHVRSPTNSPAIK
ncbi:MAG: hypothetical protein C5B50_09025 [Verrucomicrobia bacterium]|nr:MAG: hypothetical protein C5B50_09025 [Verrucomicrobiota bacterium]